MSSDEPWDEPGIELFIQCMGLNWKIPNIIMILGTIKRGLRQRAYSLTSSKHHRNALVTYVPNQVVQYSESKVFTCFGHVNYVRNSKVRSLQ